MYHEKNGLLALTLVSALILSLLAGCGGDSQPGGSSSGGGKSSGSASASSGVELNVVTSYGGDGNRKQYEAAVASYEETTGNTILDADAKTVQLFGDAAFLIDCSWKVNCFVDNCSDTLSDYAISYDPARGSARPLRPSAASPWPSSSPRRLGTAPPSTVKHMTSDEMMSTFVTAEVTALKNGASPAGLNALQQAAVDANANITGVLKVFDLPWVMFGAGMPQDRGWLTGTYMYDQTFNRGNVDYGSAIAVLIVVLCVLFSNVANRV